MGRTGLRSAGIYKLKNYKNGEKGIVPVKQMDDAKTGLPGEDSFGDTAMKKKFKAIEDEGAKKGWSKQKIAKKQKAFKTMGNDIDGILGMQLCIGSFDPTNQDVFYSTDMDDLPLNPNEEWNVISIGLPAKLMMGSLCPLLLATKGLKFFDANQYFKVGVAFNMCNGFPIPDFAVQISGELIECMMSEGGITASSLGISKAIANELRNTQYIAAGFSITNQFRKDFVIYTGVEEEIGGTTEVTGEGNMFVMIEQKLPVSDFIPDRFFKVVARGLIMVKVFDADSIVEIMDVAESGGDVAFAVLDAFTKIQILGDIDLKVVIPFGEMGTLIAFLQLPQEVEIQLGSASVYASSDTGPGLPPRGLYIYLEAKDPLKQALKELVPAIMMPLKKIIAPSVEGMSDVLDDVTNFLDEFDKLGDDKSVALGLTLNERALAFTLTVPLMVKPPISLGDVTVDCAFAFPISGCGKHAGEDFCKDRCNSGDKHSESEGCGVYQFTKDSKGLNLKHPYTCSCALCNGCGEDEDAKKAREDSRFKEGFKSDIDDGGDPFNGLVATASFSTGGFSCGVKYETPSVFNLISKLGVVIISAIKDLFNCEVDDSGNSTSTASLIEASAVAGAKGALCADCIIGMLEETVFGRWVTGDITLAEAAEETGKWFLEQGAKILSPITDLTDQIPDMKWRGVGKVMDTCPAGYEQPAGSLLCFQKCRPGYTRVAYNCVQNCESGTADLGLWCSKKTKVYTRKADDTKGLKCFQRSVCKGPEHNKRSCSSTSSALLEQSHFEMRRDYHSIDTDEAADATYDPALMFLELEGEANGTATHAYATSSLDGDSNNGASTARSASEVLAHSGDYRKHIRMKRTLRMLGYSHEHGSLHFEEGEDGSMLELETIEGEGMAMTKPFFDGHVSCCANGFSASVKVGELEASVEIKDGKVMVKGRLGDAKAHVGWSRDDGFHANAEIKGFVKLGVSVTPDGRVCSDVPDCDWSNLCEIVPCSYGQEAIGPLCFDECNEGFAPLGPICAWASSCPEGMTEGPGGAYCVKDVYPSPSMPLSCGPGYESVAGFCLPMCGHKTKENDLTDYPHQIGAMCYGDECSAKKPPAHCARRTAHHAKMVAARKKENALRALNRQPALPAVQPPGPAWKETEWNIPKETVQGFTPKKDPNPHVFGLGPVENEYAECEAKCETSPPVKARYVEIKKIGTKACLNIMEIEVYGANHKKMTIDPKKVVTSSNYDAKNNPGGNVVDGDQDTMWHSECNKGDQYVKLDLGSSQVISRVTVVNRPKFDSRLAGAHLLFDGAAKKTFGGSKSTYDFHWKSGFAPGLCDWCGSGMCCSATKAPHYSKAFGGECKGPEIRMYEGDGDNPGSTAQRVKRCATACREKNSPKNGVSWTGYDALGFAVVPGTGRCYCESQDSATCTRIANSYERYDFITTAKAATSSNSACPHPSASVFWGSAGGTQDNKYRCYKRAFKDLSELEVAVTGGTSGMVTDAANAQGKYFIEHRKNPVIVVGKSPGKSGKTIDCGSEGCSHCRVVGEPEGRYLQITRASACLNIMEIEVYGLGGAKISVAGVTTSSIWEAKEAGDKAIDGDKNTMWHSKCASNEEWIKLDLGKVQTVSRIVVTNRGSQPHRINDAILTLDGQELKTFAGSLTTFDFGFAPPLRPSEVSFVYSPTRNDRAVGTEDRNQIDVEGHAGVAGLYKKLSSETLNGQAVYARHPKNDRYLSYFWPQDPMWPEWTEPTTKRTVRTGGWGITETIDGRVYGTMGRFLELKKTGKACLNVMEIEIYVRSGSTIRHKLSGSDFTATSSSDYASVNAVDKLFDGDKTTMWHSACRDQTEWVTRVVVTARDDGWLSRMADSKLILDGKVIYSSFDGKKAEYEVLLDASYMGNEKHKPAKFWMANAQHDFPTKLTDKKQQCWKSYVPRDGRRFDARAKEPLSCSAEGYCVGFEGSNAYCYGDYDKCVVPKGGCTPDKCADAYVGTGIVGYRTAKRWTPTGPQTQCTDETKVKCVYGMGQHGWAPHGKGSADNSFEGCMKFCMKQSDCAAFDFTPERSDYGACRLYKAWQNKPRTSTSYTSADKNPKNRLYCSCHAKRKVACEPSTSKPVPVGTKVTKRGACKGGSCLRDVTVTGHHSTAKSFSLPAGNEAVGLYSFSDGSQSWWWPQSSTYHEDLLLVDPTEQPFDAVYTDGIGGTPLSWMATGACKAENARVLEKTGDGAYVGKSESEACGSSPSAECKARVKRVNEKREQNMLHPGMCLEECHKQGGKCETFSFGGPESACIEWTNCRPLGDKYPDEYPSVVSMHWGGKDHQVDVYNPCPRHHGMQHANKRGYYCCAGSKRSWIDGKPLGCCSMVKSGYPTDYEGSKDWMDIPWVDEKDPFVTARGQGFCMGSASLGYRPRNSEEWGQGKYYHSTKDKNFATYSTKPKSAGEFRVWKTWSPAKSAWVDDESAGVHFHNSKVLPEWSSVSVVATKRGHVVGWNQNLLISCEAGSEGRPIYKHATRSTHKLFHMNALWVVGQTLGSDAAWLTAPSVGTMVGRADVVESTGKWLYLRQGGHWTASGSGGVSVAVTHPWLPATENTEREKGVAEHNKAKRSLDAKGGDFALAALKSGSGGSAFGWKMCLDVDGKGPVECSAPNYVSKGSGALCQSCGTNSAECCERKVCGNAGEDGAAVACSTDQFPKPASTLCLKPAYEKEPTTNKRCKDSSSGSYDAKSATQGGHHSACSSVGKDKTLACCRKACDDDKACTGFTVFTDGGCQISKSGCVEKLPNYVKDISVPTKKGTGTCVHVSSGKAVTPAIASKDACVKTKVNEWVPTKLTATVHKKNWQYTKTASDKRCADADADLEITVGTCKDSSGKALTGPKFTNKADCVKASKTNMWESKTQPACKDVACCRNACSAEGQCTGFAFFSDKTCQLSKTECKTMYDIKKPSVISSVYSKQTAGGTFSYRMGAKSGKSCSDGIYEASCNGKGTSCCQTACDDDKECTAFAVFSDGDCQLSRKGCLNMIKITKDEILPSTKTEKLKSFVYHKDNARCEEGGSECCAPKTCGDKTGLGGGAVQCNGGGRFRTKTNGKGLFANIPCKDCKDNGAECCVEKTCKNSGPEGGPVQCTPKTCTTTTTTTTDPKTKKTTTNKKTTCTTPGWFPAKPMTAAVAYGTDIPCTTCAKNGNECCVQKTCANGGLGGAAVQCGTDSYHKAGATLCADCADEGSECCAPLTECATLPYRKANYIEIRKRGSACLVVNELEVYDREGKKVPIQQSGVMASSYWGDNNAPKGLVDGDKGSSWHSKCDGKPEWIRVDLGGVRTVSKIIVTNRKSGANGLDGAELLLDGGDGHFLAHTFKGDWTALHTIDPNVFKKKFPHGRHLEISRKGADACLNLMEVEVFDSNGNKLTIAGSAVTSSSEAWGGKNEHVVDGDKNTMYHSACDGKDQWVAVDLGASTSISRVVVTNRAGYHAWRIDKSEMKLDGKVLKRAVFQGKKALYNFDLALGEYESQKATKTADRQCTPLSACLPGRTETKAATKTSDRTCAPKTCGNTGVACGASQYSLGATKACTACADDGAECCATLDVCTAAQYESKPATKTSNRVCTALTPACDLKTHWESVSPTKARNRVCTALTVCTGAKVPGGVGKYEFDPPTKTTDRDCEALTVCTSAQYESKAESPTTNRECTKLTDCLRYGPNKYYESKKATRTTDRVCTKLTECDPKTHYESAAPTPTTDRQCGKLTECNAPKSLYRTGQKITLMRMEGKMARRDFGGSCMGIAKVEVFDEFGEKVDLAGSGVSLTSSASSGGKKCAEDASCAASLKSLAQGKADPKGKGHKACGSAGQWLTIDLGAKIKVTRVKITSAKGDEPNLARATLLMDTVTVTALIATVPHYSKAFGGECKGPEIRMYEGDGDNPGSTAQRVKRCATACRKKNAPKNGVSWTGYDALGFAVVPGTGRCYCESQDSATCTRIANSYERYDFITAAKAVHDVGMGFAVGDASGEEYAEHDTSWSKGKERRTSQRVCSGTITNCVNLVASGSGGSGYTLDPSTKKRCENGKHNSGCSGCGEKCDLACCRKVCDGDKTCNAFTYFSDGGCQISTGHCKRIPSYNSWIYNPHKKKHETLESFIYQKKSATYKPATFESVAPTLTSDRVCSTVASECSSGEFEAVAPTGKSNRVCAMYSAKCNSGTHYETQPATKTQDRACKAYTPCKVADMLFVSAPGTATADQQCSKLKTCDFHTEFESKPPTRKGDQFVSDRVCKRLTVCDYSKEYDMVEKTTTRDRSCATLNSKCTASQYEKVSPTKTRNRECASLTPKCNHKTHWESVSPTKTRNRVCTKLTKCKSDEVEVSNPMYNKDRICAKSKSSTTTCPHPGGCVWECDVGLKCQCRSKSYGCPEQSGSMCMCRVAQAWDGYSACPTPDYARGGYGTMCLAPLSGGGGSSSMMGGGGGGGGASSMMGGGGGGDDEDDDEDLYEDDGGGGSSCSCTSCACSCLTSSQARACRDSGGKRLY